MYDMFNDAPLAFFEPRSTGLVLPTGQDRERADQLPAADAFASSPFYHSTPDQHLLEQAVVPASAIEVDPLTLKRLRRLRRSPGFALLADSPLLLQSIQLDMDYPRPWHSYARQCVSAWLLQVTGKPLDPDTVRLRLHSAHAWIDEQGLERDSLECSLTEMVIASADMPYLVGLVRSAPVEDHPLPEAPQLSASILLRQVIDAPWHDDYQQQRQVFWKRHTPTWLNLARLSFIDALARQRKRHALSAAGLRLTLDALGYPAFPHDALALAPGVTTDKVEVRLLYIDDKVVPGLFQVRSRLNSHCFIHLPGTARASIEYISDDEAVMTARLLKALNDSGWHRRWLDNLALPDQAPGLESRPFTGDVFNELLLAARNAAEDPPAPHGDALLHRLIARGMTLACAVDLWQTTPEILDNLPDPYDIAAERMQHWLQERHGLDLDPRQVFIAYRSGPEPTPLGHVRHAGTHVHVPDEKPLNLAQALISHYQIEQPAGYLDPGAQTVVYHDASGKGEWDRDRVLPVSAVAVCEHIAQLDFLAIMTRHLDAFWDGQHTRIEQALRAQLVTQAVISLKHGALKRRGFDEVVEGLGSTTPCWRALGFDIQNSFLEGIRRQPCASLLVLCPPGTSRRVLYQAGQHKAFIEFETLDALNAYLRRAAADEQWRTAVLHYVPRYFHERLDYLFRYWSGDTAPLPPASMLRPWTDVIYNPDVHRGLDQSLHEYPLPPGPPMSFMRQTLKTNELEEARQLIVTPGQVSLQYWSAFLRHLYVLLAPMSLLMTPALITMLATEVGLVALDIAQANLPGDRHKDKRQALLSMLTLGLLGMAPHTPRLLRALGKLGKAVPGVTPARARPLHAPDTGWHLAGQVRQTRLEKFFHTDSLLKRWTIAPHPYFGGLAVHAWKLGRKFLLWTSDRGQARTLVVSTHGHYLPWTRTVAIPHGTQVHTYAPHGHVLIDPTLHRVVSQRVSPFAVSGTAGNTPVAVGSSLPPLVVTDKLMAGTALRGRLKNYTLSKFQGQGGESYQEIIQAVRNSNARPFPGQLPATPMDVLSVRQRFGSTAPTLDELFQNLATRGIHYDQILLLHCRCAAIDALLQRAPVWTAPASGGVAPISP